LEGGKVHTNVIPHASPAFSVALCPMIARKVVPDSIVFSDYWRAYNALDASDFKYFSLNHFEFLEPRKAPYAKIKRCSKGAFGVF